MSTTQSPPILVSMTDEQILNAVTFGDKGDINDLNKVFTPYTVSTKLGNLSIVTEFKAAMQMGITLRKENTSLTSDDWNTLLRWRGFFAIFPQNSTTPLEMTILQNGTTISPYYVSSDGVNYYKTSTVDTSAPLTIEVANQSGSETDTATWNWSSLNESALETQVDNSIPQSSWVTEPGGTSTKDNGVTTQSQSPPDNSTQPTSGSSAGQSQPLKLSDQPVVLHGRTFVPMRELFEALGATVQWDAEYQIVTATKGNTTIKLQIGNLDAYINGNQQVLNDSPFIENSRTFVPLRFASEALGENVSYNASTTKVTFGNYYFYINPNKASLVTPTTTSSFQQSNTGSQSPSGTFTANGDHFAGDGLDVSAVASLNTDLGGVNGTIEVTVTVNAPTDVSGVSVGESYEAWGWPVNTNLSQLSHSGNTWTFALFADQLNKNQPFQVRLYKNVQSGSDNPAFATIIFKWPTNLLQYMAN